MNIQPTRVLAVTLASLGLIGGGCAASGAGAGAARSKDCLAGQGKAIAGRPVIAVVVQGGDPSDVRARQIREEAFATVLDAGFASKAQLLVQGVGGGVSDADLVANVSLERRGANGQYRRADEACKRRMLGERFNGLLEHPGAGPADIVGAISVLGERLAALGAPAPVHVALLSDMAQTASPVLDDPATIASGAAATVEDLSRQHRLASCEKWDVAVAAAGTAPGQTPGATRFHRQFWSTLFQRCGAKLLAYDSQLVRFPAAGLPILPDPESPVTARMKESSTDNKVVLTLPSGVLFPTGSATVAPAAEPELRQALTRIGDYAGASVQIGGHTDDVGEPSANQVLSERRALVVAKWLIDQGLPSDRVAATGYGQTRPVADNATPEGRAANRRVEIAVIVAVGP